MERTVDGNSVSTAAKLPVFATVGRAYGSMFSNFGTFLRISWLWIVVIAALNWLMTWLTNMLMPGNLILTAANFAKFGAAEWILLSAVGFVQSLVTIPFLSSIAVNWHRLLLLNERPEPTAFARLDSPVWSYTALAAVLALGKAIVSLVQVLGRGDPTGAGSFIAISVGIGAMAAYMFLARYSIGLPAKALGIDVGADAAYTATRGNTWRIGWGFVLSFLPMLVAAAYASFVWPGAARFTEVSDTASAIRALFVVLSVLSGIVSVGFISYTYEHFFPIQRSGQGMAR
jgi:hypothetical protein